MGFGHRVYKNTTTPRHHVAHVQRGAQGIGIRTIHCSILPSSWRTRVGGRLFIEKKLYPNVDFYSGIIFEAMGIP